MKTCDLRRRTLLHGIGALCAGVTLPSRAREEALNDSLRFILPLAAGGAADVSTRPLAVELQRAIRQPMIVENRPGGLFMIGLQAVLQAPADGRTLIYLYNSVASVQAVHKRYDINRQLIPVTQTTSIPMVLLVPGSSPFKTLEELVAFGRDNPGKLNYASLGVGSTEHLKAAQLERAADFQAMNVPYKSGPDMVTGLIGGAVDFVLTAATFAHVFAPKGLVRVLAVVNTERMKDMPEVPTISEAGVTIPPLEFWGGYGVRAGTPEATVQRLFDALTTAAVKPAVRDLLAPSGISVATSSSSKSFAKLIADDVRWMTEMTEQLSIKPSAA